MPIESKKQSAAKNNWMRDNSKIYSVRIMKRTESDLYEYISAQTEKGVNAATLFKLALREYIKNHEND